MSYQEGEQVLVDGVGGRIEQVVFDGLVIETDDGRGLGHKILLTVGDMRRVSHIPEPAPLDPRPGQRISSLAD